MKKFLRNIIFFLLLIMNCCLHVSAQYNVEYKEQAIHLADPTIFFYAGTYYLYGTVEGNTNEGFLVYTSTNLKKWELSKARGGYALHKGDVFGTANFWAPQVFYYHNRFYMAYVANEHIAIAESESPLGPFVQKIKRSVDSAVKQIDPFVFIDNNGKKYLYHVRLSNGNNLFVEEISDDFSTLRTGTLKECISATDNWENTAHTSWPVTEGPSVLKHKNLYYLFYTANDFHNPDYAVGYAVSKKPEGPWKKYINNPIISRNNIGKNGTGHGDFIKDNSNNFFYVFHTHNSDSTVTPRTTAMVKVRFEKDAKSGIDKLAVVKETFYYLKSYLKK